MPLAGFAPTITASERLQAYALDRAATVIGELQFSSVKFSEKIYKFSPVNHGDFLLLIFISAHAALLRALGFSWLLLASLGFKQ